MVNLAVTYQRANYAVSTLSAEVKARWGTLARPPEYVTGYKSASNLTGHNADSNGICHAVDLFFSNNSAWSEARGWELAEWLRTVEGPKGAIPGYPDRMYYIIYRDRIAGDFSGWQWVGANYGHWDHIHVSTCDMFWGDPAPIPAGDYDSKAPWGFASPGLASAGDTITPIQEDDMATVPQDQWEHALRVLNSLADNAVTDKKLKAALEPLPTKVWSYANPGIGGGDAYQILRDAVANTDRLAGDIAAVAANVAAGGASKEQIETAVKEVISNSSLQVVPDAD